MAYTEDFEVKDASLDRTFELENNTLHVRRYDPYGFWKISYERGPIPDELKGDFTSFDEASKVVKAYLNRRNKEIKSSKTV